MDSGLITVIASLGAPILVIIGGLLSWFLKTRKEELKAVEERALERRVETYNTLLHPLIVQFSNQASKNEKEKAIKEIGSVEYRKSGFNLVTFGSDEMVKAYNQMMQSFYKGEAEKKPKLVMEKFAKFLLAIRKDLHNKKTKLHHWEMLEFMITDIENFKD